MEFWNYSIWDLTIQFGIICLLILFANILRRKIGFLNKSLLPTAVIGGFVALGLRSFGLLNMIDTQVLNAITYHALSLGFIALALKRSYGTPESKQKGASYRTGLTIVGTYLLQGAVGIFITLVLGSIFVPSLFKAAGILLPLGFGQGPGQANNFGSIFESQYGFLGGQSFGLSIASIGFIVSCLVVVFWVKRQVKQKGYILKEEHVNVNGETVNPVDEVPLSEAVDKMTLQVGIVMLVFLMSFAFMWGFDQLFIQSGIMGTFGVNTIRPMLWGFNFIFGTLFAIVFKRTFGFLKSKGLAKREYCNNYILNRISGLVFDFMIIASICLIDISTLASLWWVLLLVCGTGAFVTFFYLQFVCKKTFKGYEVESFVCLYGNLTGTASTAMALLKVVDPNFETPASTNLVSGSVFAVLFGFPLMLILGFAPIMPWITFFALIAFSVVINFLLFYTKKPKINVANQAQTD